MSIKSLFCSITALVASSMGISLGAINSLKNLAADIKLSFPEAKGYSVRNLKYMAKFAATYEDEGFMQTASEQIPWSHNKVILDKGAQHELHFNSRKDSSATQIAFQVAYCTRLQTKYSFPGVGISP